MKWVLEQLAVEKSQTAKTTKTKACCIIKSSKSSMTRLRSCLPIFVTYDHVINANMILPTHTS